MTGRSTGVYSGRRPRTRVYDCNYSMGEGYYRPTLDQLDEKRFVRPMRPEERIEVDTAGEALRDAKVSWQARRQASRPRPISMGELEWEATRLADQAHKALHTATARTYLEEAEQSFDSAFTLRREETKRRFAEKMLDSVGINGDREMLKKVRAVARLEGPKWPATPEVGESAEELAASGRARASRVRMLNLHQQISDDMSDRYVSGKRAAALLSPLLSHNTLPDPIPKRVTIADTNARQ